MKKKLISLGLVSVLCLSFAGCGKEEPKTLDEAIAQNKDAIKQGTDALKKIGDELKESQEKKKKEFEKSKVKVKDNITFENSKFGKLVLKSYGFDKDNIVLTYEYTNTTENDSSARVFLQQISAYQDGAKLNEYITTYSEDDRTNIKTGTTVNAGTSFGLRNKTSDIELEFTGYDGEKQTHTLKIK